MTEKELTIRIKRNNNIPLTEDEIDYLLEELTLQREVIEAHETILQYVFRGHVGCEDYNA